MDILQFRAILTPNIALKCKKINCTQKLPPPPGDLTSVFADAKIFVIGTIFTPKIVQKWPTKMPPVGGQARGITPPPAKKIKYMLRIS